MQDAAIKNEFLEILQSNDSLENKMSKIDTILEQVKIAYFLEGVNDFSRHKAQQRKIREALVTEQEKTGKVVFLQPSH